MGLSVSGFFLVKSVDALKYTSTIGVVCLTLAFGVFLSYAGTFPFKGRDPALGDNAPGIGYKQNFFMPVSEDIEYGPSSAMMFMDGIGYVFFAYICQFQILFLNTEMKNPKDIYPVIHLSILG